MGTHEDRLSDLAGVVAPVIQFGTLDLTGAGLWFTATTSPAATTVVFQKTLGGGITVTDPASGIDQIQLEPGDTSALASRQVQLYFDLEVELAGNVYPVAAGRLVVEPDVTVRG